MREGGEMSGGRGVRKGLIKKTTVSIKYNIANNYCSQLDNNRSIQEGR